MHLHPIFLLVAISPVFSLVRAGWAHHNGVRHISNQFHRAVIRRSADLATDTRIALRGLVAGKPSKRRRLTRRSIVDASYCVAVTYHNGHLNPPVISNGTGIDPSPSAPTGTSTTAGNPAATTSSPSGKSSFNLVQNYGGPL
ncbi:hypothetical protein OF83DRAFT_264248 [Amylostereum chailletii]|nr:hypothetical protein OF83DRAFT_264248 [Amylostereum chailletii]